jgi:hypothetical protein
VTKGAATPVPQAAPFPPQFLLLSQPWQWGVQISQLQGSQVYFILYLVGKLNCRCRTLSSAAAIPAHATATVMHFPANAGLIFLTDELTYDRYLVDTGATLSIVSALQILVHLATFSKGQMNNLSPLRDLYRKPSSFMANFSLPVSCKPLWQVPFWALTF